MAYRSPDIIMAFALPLHGFLVVMLAHSSFSEMVNRQRKRIQPEDWDASDSNRTGDDYHRLVMIALRN